MSACKLLESGEKVASIVAFMIGVFPSLAYTTKPTVFTAHLPLSDCSAE